MEKNSAYEFAYKKKSSTIDKRALRLHRRSVEWKSNRDERLNSARNLESLSPLQEISHNSTVNQNYEGKTPSKTNVESCKVTKSQVKGLFTIYDFANRVLGKKRGEVNNLYSYIITTLNIISLIYVCNSTQKH